MRIVGVSAASAAFVFAIAVGVASVSTVAEEAPADNGFVSVPDAPPGVAGDAQVEPEVTIRETENQVIYEYRVRGRLYMVKVEPVIGPPYYMLDINGDGILDVQEQRPPELAVPQWLLFRW